MTPSPTPGEPEIPSGHSAQAPSYADALGSSGLIEALRSCKRRIGDMCGELRPPSMSIPVREDDDDIFICATIDKAIAGLNAAARDAGRYRWLRELVGENSDAVMAALEAEDSYPGTPEAMDAAVDAAMVALAEQQEKP